MFISEKDNYSLAVRFWEGLPSRKLLWALDADFIDVVAEKNGFGSVMEFYRRELGCITWGNFCDVAPVSNPEVEIHREQNGTLVRREYRSRCGTLSEDLIDGQIVRHKVACAEDLKIWIEMNRSLQITDRRGEYDFLSSLDPSTPALVSTGCSSAVQQFLQYEIGVADFWYLALDCPELLEEAMTLWQEMLAKKYALMAQVPSIGCYQSENTSTLMISPDFYQRYSVSQIRQFTQMAVHSGKKSMLHMCGHLYDLMPSIRDTGVDFIHALSAPSIGNTPFEYAFELMPSNFGTLGRFGSLEWIGKQQKEIVGNLRRLLPHWIFREHPFILLVTSDGADYSRQDLLNLRDAVEEYENKQ